MHVEKEIGETQPECLQEIVNVSVQAGSTSYDERVRFFGDGVCIT